jgi:hypothetical protein
MAFYINQKALSLAEIHCPVSGRNTHTAEIMFMECKEVLKSRFVSDKLKFCGCGMKVHIITSEY